MASLCIALPFAGSFRPARTVAGPARPRGADAHGQVRVEHRAVPLLAARGGARRQPPPASAQGGGRVGHRAAGRLRERGASGRAAAGQIANEADAATRGSWRQGI